MITNDLKTTEFTGATIILPLVDEANSVIETVRIIFDCCDKNDIAEILFVLSQKATDECRESVKNIIRQYTDVEINSIVQVHPHIGGAAQDAFAIAKGSHIVTMPSDMELDPRCVADMIMESKKYPDKIITTSRWLIKNNFTQYRRFKKFFNYNGQKFLSLLFGAKLTDMTSPTQLCPSKIYNSIRWERYDFPFLLELTLKPLRLGVEFVEIPVKLSSRKEGKSSNSFLLTAMYLPVAFHNRFISKKKILK